MIILAGLGGFLVTEALKIFWPWQIVSHRVKLGVAVVASGLLVLWHVDGVADGATSICGAAGIAVLSHRVHRFLGAAGDEKRAAVAFALSRRR